MRGLASMLRVLAAACSHAFEHIAGAPDTGADIAVEPDTRHDPGPLPGPGTCGPAGLHHGELGVPSHPRAL